ncbi:MAG TPA: hypothetical protein VF458_20705 [Ktedonobacteraceae bacterium]
MKTLSRRIWALAITSFLVLASLATALGMFSGSIFKAHAASSWPSSYFAPYQDVTIDPSLQSVTQSTGQKYYTLAFITANGCQAEWGGTVPLSQTGSQLPHLDSDISYIRGQGGDVMVSFGGAAGQELAQVCTSASSLQAQYQAVVTKYSLTHLDFDIEGGQEGDSTTYDRRNIALAALQAANPGLTIDFTLPSDTTGPTSEDMGLLNNAKSHGVNFSVVNLMTMDYNGPDSQMGQEAINAANGLFSQLQNMFPSKTSSQLWSMVGLTNLIGQNDTAGEIYTISNAQQDLTFAQQKQLGELSFWEVSRDNGGCPGNTNDLDTCSGLSQSTYQFTNIFKVFTTSGGTVTPTPTATNTPTSTPTSVTGGITNGGFETGDFTGWTRSGTTSISSTAHSGSHAAELGTSAPTNGDSSIKQTFTAPSGATGLSFYYDVRCPDDVTYDWATASLKDNTAGTTSTILPKTCTNATTWVQVSASVTAGHSYTLTLTSHDENNPGDPTYTLYDDVTLTSSVSTPTPTPTPVTGGITNGGFETGDFTGWTRSGTTSISSTAHSGSHSAELGTNAPTNGDSSLKQTFTAPTGTTTLSFYYDVRCPDDVTYDWATATLKDNTTGTTTTILARTCTSSTTWVKVSAGTTAGHSYTLTLISHDENNPGDPTYTLYDDVALS